MKPGKEKAGPVVISTDIITLLYGDRKDLDRLIKSIEECCIDYNLIIVDNNKQNIGFTKGINTGIVQGSAPYVWLLNQDAIVCDRDSQQALIDRLALPRAGIVGSMQLDPENHDRIAHSGTSRAFPGGCHKGGLVSMGHGRIPEKQTWVNFASVMMKREMINQIGPMDEDMFLVFSDSDYCYTARSKSWECWYEPRSRVYHTLKASKSVTEWHQKDMQAFMKKWGIVQTEQGFIYSDEFQKLDMFP